MKYFLLTVSTFGLISPAFAQTSEINCTPAPDCASLGYTESSCPDGAGLKCPFGNKWFCITDFCPNQGTLDSCPSPYTCTLEKCSNKYYKSGCQSGYDWNASSKTCTKQCANKGTLTSCPSPFTCTLETCSGKYYKSGCQSGYTWNSSSQTCTAQCSSSYKYSCSGGDHVIGGSGIDCDGLYQSCVCEDGYMWFECMGKAYCAEWNSGTAPGCFPI